MSERGEFSPRQFANYNFLRYSDFGMNLRHLSPRDLIRYWGPAILMLACIMVESTDLMSAQHTHGWVYFFLRKYFPQVSPGQLWEVNLIIRKTGHVVGYGLLGATLYRAFRGTFEQVPTPGPKWQLRFASFAVFGTFLVASADEIHQMYLPSRTGSWWDVLLDTSAAVVAQVIVYWYFRRRARKTSEPTPSTAAITTPTR
jgi:VanZ family protein